MTFRVPQCDVCLAPEGSQVGRPVVWEGAAKRWFAGRIVGVFDEINSYEVEPLFEVDIEREGDLATNPDFSSWKGSGHAIAMTEAVLAPIPPKLYRAIMGDSR